MRMLTLVVLASVCCSPAMAQDEPPAAPAPALKTNLDKMNYGIGLNIGEQLKRQGFTVNTKLIFAGIVAGLSGAEPALKREEISAAFTAYEAEKAVANKEAGKKFLSSNASKEGIKVTKSGLQYKVLKAGTGATPTKDSTVSTHYRGTLVDGTVFDQSYSGEAPTAADKPVSFGVTQVIAGWTEALQLMKVGAKYRLYIPSDLAYGENGPPGIGANSTLIFDIELLDVK